MKKKISTGLAIGLGFFAFVGFVSAGSLTVNYDASATTFTTTSLTGSATLSEDMLGMLVTATFTDGSSQTGIWAEDTAAIWGNDAYAGGSDGSWALTQTGDTLIQEWDFYGRPDIVRLFIDAGAGDAVFDVWPSSFDGSPLGTDGSGLGRAFSLSSSSPWDLNVTYSGLVALGSADPLGDVYRYLSIDLSNHDSSPAAAFSFRADTDSISFPGDINPVPAPISILLLGTGLVTLAGSRFRRKKKA